MLAEYFKKGLKLLQEDILPLVQIALVFIPGGQIPAAGLRVLEKLPDILASAERIFDAGADKKAYAIQTAQMIASRVKDESTGGQKETWMKIEAAVGPVIDRAVSIINKFKEDDISAQAAAVNASATP